MKNSIVILALLLLINHSLTGQVTIGVFDYLVVDDHEEFLEIEKGSKKINEVRIKNGMIVGWGLYQVMFKNFDSRYDFVSIVWYDSFSKLDKDIPKEVLNEAFPEKLDVDWRIFFERKKNSRKTLTSGVFQQKLGCNNGIDNDGIYFVINEINVKQSNSEKYLQINEEIYQPLFEESIRNDTRVAWTLWAKWPGTMKGFHYLSADGYSSLEQIDEVNDLKYFNEVHPDKNIDQISDTVEELSTLINSEIWKNIYKVLK
jgi:hypothetical protein